MRYRLNLYVDRKLTSTELIEAATLEGAKLAAKGAVAGGQAHKAELVNNAGSIIFERRADL